MSWINTETNDKIYSTTEAAKDVHVHPVTLRKWLASRELQQWLEDKGLGSLCSIRQAHGRRVWQFRNKDRENLRRFVEERDGWVPEKPDRPDRYPLTPEARKRNRVLLKYCRVLAELSAIGIGPKDPYLARVPGQRATEQAMKERILPPFFADEQRRVIAEHKAR